MSEPSSMLTRRVVRFAGRVQGVGFRYTTEALAARFNVTGYVKNLSDGRVELVAEGSADELDRFQKAVAERMAGFIARIDASESPATGEFHSFSIGF